MITQSIFDFTPQVGELWVVWDEIVMVTRVGSNDRNRFLPNCIEFIGLGYAKYDGPGRWWEVDFLSPSYDFERNRLDDGPRRCDRCYFKTWNGKGVFFATGDAEKAATLLIRWHNEMQSLHARKSKHKGVVFGREKVETIESRLKRLFSKQVAPEGFL